MATFDLKRLRQFVAVTESKSLSSAAREMGISQSTLTQSIRALEDGLGFELFDREKGFSLTPLGGDFLPQVQALLQVADDTEHEADLLCSGEAGSLKMVCGTTMAETMIPPAMARIARERPGLRIDLQVGDVREVPSLLRKRLIDLAVVEYTLFEHEPDLKIIPLPDQEVVFVCRSGHPLTRKRRKLVSFDEFFSFPLVASFLPDWAVRWMQANHPGGLAKDGLTISCNHFTILRAIVAQSDAVTGIPEPVVRRELEEGTLVKIRLETPPLKNQAGVVFLRERRLSPSAEYLVKILKTGEEGLSEPGTTTTRKS